MTSQSPLESGAGVTASVSPMRPDVFEREATPRRDTTRQVPGCPSTASRSGTARVEPTGQSLGDCQSYGPHSSTTIAERSRRARSDVGTERWCAADVSDLDESTALKPVVLRESSTTRSPAKTLSLMR